MYKHIGYVWPGMKRISLDEAKELFKLGASVFRLYDNNAEGEVTEASELEENMDYGVEFGKHFTFEEYFGSNANADGVVVFSHGVDNATDLLALAVDFFEVSKVELKDTQRRVVVSLEKFIEYALLKLNDTEKEDAWDLVQYHISEIIPKEWKFGMLDSSGLDYGFSRK